jgi:hypothetical protein
MSCRENEILGDDRTATGVGIEILQGDLIGRLFDPDVLTADNPSAIASFATLAQHRNSQRRKNHHSLHLQNSSELQDGFGLRRLFSYLSHFYRAV